MPMKIQVDSRLERKAVMFNPRSKKSVIRKLEMMRAMDIAEVLQASHKLLTTGVTPDLWVMRASKDLRIIYRRSGLDSIDVIDVVSHADLDKFVSRR